MEASGTAYDDSFRTLLKDWPQLIIPMVNEVFGENYTGQEKIILSVNELLIEQDDGNEEKRITDSNFSIVSPNGKKKRYHMECEANFDETIIVRLFEYDAQFALSDGKMEGATLTVSFPHSAVMALRHTKNTPTTMNIQVVAHGGVLRYSVPVIKVLRFQVSFWINAPFPPPPPRHPFFERHGRHK